MTSQIDISTVEIPYGRPKILAEYKKNDYKRDETVHELSYYRHFLPFVKARPVTCETTGQIYRLRQRQKEFLKYFVTYRGHDYKGNELTFTTLVGQYEIPKFVKLRSMTTNEDGTSQETVQVNGHEVVYDIPFTKVTFDKLIEQMNPDAHLYLMIIDHTGRKYSCSSKEFREDSYEEIIDRKNGFADYLAARKQNQRFDS